MSVTELLDYGFIIVCIYRSPDSNFWTFLNIRNNSKNSQKGKNLCGDWNLNFVG
jgi:hypothetical protein